MGYNTETNMKKISMLLCAVAILLMGCGNGTNNGKEGAKEEKGSKVANENSDPGTVKDQDGNEYKTVKIGQQVWMAENMRATHDRDGNAIVMDSDLGSQKTYHTPYRYCPGGSSDNVKKFGYLYNWAAAMKVCPEGWHLPTDTEWTQLTNYVGTQSQYRCGDNKDYIAKALASKTEWDSSSEQCAVGNNPSLNNATGFSALPAGGRSGGFCGDACFWSATEQTDNIAYSRSLSLIYASVSCQEVGKQEGMSVRCVRD